MGGVGGGGGRTNRPPAALCRNRPIAHLTSTPPRNCLRAETGKLPYRCGRTGGEGPTKKAKDYLPVFTRCKAARERRGAHHGGETERKRQRERV